MQSDNNDNTSSKKFARHLRALTEELENTKTRQKTSVFKKAKQVETLTGLKRLEQMIKG